MFLSLRKTLSATVFGISVLLGSLYNSVFTSPFSFKVLTAISFNLGDLILQTSFFIQAMVFGLLIKLYLSQFRINISLVFSSYSIFLNWINLSTNFSMVSVLYPVS